MQNFTPSYVRRTLSSRIRTFLLHNLRLLVTQVLGPAISPVALLIDGDNNSDMSPELLAQILVEAGKFGGVTMRRVYGNWREPSMDRWKDLCGHYAIEPIHHMQTTVAGKNAADIALAIDALDLLRCNGVKHFCLVASDSDYIPLVRRLRDTGCIVVIIGKATTLPALVKACTVFIPIEKLVFIPSKTLTATPKLMKVAEQSLSIEIKEALIAPSQESVEPTLEANTQLITLLLKAYTQAAEGKKDGWISIQGFHAALTRLDTSFKLSNYHYKNFAALFQAHTDLFETRKQNSGHLAIRRITE